MDKITEILAREFDQRPAYVNNVINLIDAGNTIPFIARYRKEMHGSMDDQLLRELADRLIYLRNLEERKSEILNLIESQGKLTEDLSAALDQAVTLSELEDIYRPYKQKRRTRGSVARERGLEPLAHILRAQNQFLGDLESLAEPFIAPEKDIFTANDAMKGASDIIAEDISDDAAIRKSLKALLTAKGYLVSKNITEEDTVYRLFYNYSEPIEKIQSHRILAVNRGEKEKVLKVNIELDNSSALTIIKEATVIPGSISSSLVENALEDAYFRLIFPSLEREIRSDLTDAASTQAIKMFGLNLKPLLLQPPVKNKVTLGFDPAYRTGCKIAVVDGTGKVLETGVVYPTPPNNKKEEAKKVLSRMITQHNVEVIAIGNGTASKESEIFVADLLTNFVGVNYMMINEAGASVYSASKLGAEEFPDFDVSLRSAVSIARRLQDPMAELVKIDPKSIGVGQYQHDMPAGKLNDVLNGVVEDCVNSVGVDLNTASTSLLTRVSGLTPTTAKNIVSYREENGPFLSRKDLLKVAKIGPKIFQQCAGFLRVNESKNILDHTGVHPESYAAAESLLRICGYSKEDVSQSRVNGLRQQVQQMGEQRLSELCGVGIPTIHDIIDELMKPGRDPREELPPAMLRKDVLDIKDLKAGMVMRGTVRNVVDFGVFVDIGVHQDGLVHISELCNHFVKHPSAVAQVGDIVDTVVLSVDVEKKRISLSMKKVKDQS